MILLIVLALAIVIGLIRGGKLDRFGALPIRQGGWVLGALLLQSILIYGPWSDGPAARSMARGAMIVSYLLLIYFVWLHRALPGIRLVALGLCLNLLVIAANGGYMPASPEALSRIGYPAAKLAEGVGKRISGGKDIVLPREATRFGVLADIFALPPPFPWPVVFSLGDVVISAGVFVLVQRTMLAPSSKTDR